MRAVPAVPVLLSVSGKTRRVSNAALANAALVLSSKNGKTIRDGGQHRKINPKSLGPAFSLCRRAGIDAAFPKGPNLEKFQDLGIFKRA